MKSNTIVLHLTFIGFIIGLCILFTFAALMGAGGSDTLLLRILFGVWEALAFPFLITATLYSLLSGGGTVGELPGALSLTILSLPVIYTTGGYFLGKGLSEKNDRVLHATIGFFIGGLLYPLFSTSLLFAGAVTNGGLFLSILPGIGALVGWYMFPVKEKKRKKRTRKKKGL